MDFFSEPGRTLLINNFLERCIQEIQRKAKVIEAFQEGRSP
ncbi:hypothetical protein LEP1GSC193_0011 [Leptospira alstonii serovar Pingchang str. 80-412]|uniref:Uncharacterized protein n=1 Tax=Leptospira alstonii serovar Pingchang str. 80-412 TaxID=1218564 RepID=T0H433_9LEPT|nr:hypothetical protein LEP1GSC193_0011 [Leptospira alstonii serovar Pingchang str. 80-412]